MSTEDPRLSPDARVSRQQRRAEERRRRKEKGRGVADLAAGAAIALGAAALASPASANTIVVNSTADVIANDDGLCTLREAVISANKDTASGAVAGECQAGSGIDIVDLTALSGTITLKSNASSSYYGPIAVYTSMSINGPGAGTLSISGGGATQIFYMYSGPTASTINVSGLTLTNGYGDYGGAIASRSVGNPVTLTINDTVFTNNVATRGGGAISIFDFGTKYTPFVSLPGSVTISNSTFQNNVANVPASAPSPGGSSARGGAIFAKYLGAGASLSLDHVTLTGNHARNDGGAIAAGVACSANLSIKNSVITGNDAGIVQPDVPGTYYFYGNGGGIAVNSYAGPPAAPTTSRLKARTAKIGAPPRVAATGCDNVKISDSTISNNTSDSAGGGIYSYIGGVTIDRTTVSGNTAGSGGGVETYYSNDIITNSTIARNTASSYAGGFAGYDSALAVNNSTISGNSSPGGADAIALNNRDTRPANDTVTNSIIVNNGTVAPQLYAGGAATLTVSFTDVFPADAAPQWTDGGGNISADPLLAALAPNGTPNQGNGSTAAPLVRIPAAGSPVIDKGNTATAAGTVDERNAPRVFGAAVDMGSVEVVASGTISTNPAVTVNEAAGTITITLTRSGGTTGDITVNYTTANGTAVAPGDYTTKSGSVTFPSGGATTQTITIPIIKDTTAEPPETFVLNLSSPTAGAVATPVVTITILDPGVVPTLAWWMKLMLALTCAGVGVIMLKNGRLLVVVLAAGIAVAAAPSVNAAVAPTAAANATRGRHADPPAAGTITSVAATHSSVTIKIGTTEITAPRGHLAIIDLRKTPTRTGVEALTAGTPVVYRAIRKADGSVRRLRIGVFDTIAQANTALARMTGPQGHH